MGAASRTELDWHPRFHVRPFRSMLLRRNKRSLWLMLFWSDLRPIRNVNHWSWSGLNKYRYAETGGYHRFSQDGSLGSLTKALEALVCLPRLLRTCAIYFVKRFMMAPVLFCIGIFGLLQRRTGQFWAVPVRESQTIQKELGPMRACEMKNEKCERNLTHVYGLILFRNRKSISK